MATKTGLGTGLGALFGDSKNLIQTEDLPVEKVEPRNDQPRTVFNEPALEELAGSIAQHGVLQPITVRRVNKENYQIITGERRWRAARLAGLTEIPARILDVDDQTAQEMALVENLQRENLNPIEEAKGFQTLMETFHMTQEGVAESVGRSRSAVANSLRLLTLPKEISKMLEEGIITTGHARALLPIQDKDAQLKIARQITEKNLSVRQTEALVSSLMKKPEEKGKKTQKAEDYASVMSAQLGDVLGRKVNIIDGKKRGRIEIEYYGSDDRETLLKALMKMDVKK